MFVRSNGGGRSTDPVPPQPLGAKKFFLGEGEALRIDCLRIERFLIQDRPGKGSHCLDLPSCTNKFFFSEGKEDVEKWNAFLPAVSLGTSFA